MTQTYDVIVVGGGLAGLSGALALARSRRSLLVIDSGEPRNAPATGVHNFLGHDGINPLELLERGRAELHCYGAQIVAGRVIAADREGAVLSVTLADDRVFRARRLLITTGLIDELPDVPGVRERWGRDVLHCPYCHGWEVRDRAVGLLASGPTAVHLALLFRQLTSDIVYFSHTAPPLSGEQSRDLAARGISVVPGRVAALEVEDDRLTGVRLADGTRVSRQAIVVTPRFVARSEALASLGLEATPHPMGVGEHIAADAQGKTRVSGVWVAGNVADLSAGVAAAAASGVVAGAAINADLVAEDTRLAAKQMND